MYISLDLETTGLSSERDDIIEIGAVKFDDKKNHEKFQTFIKVPYELPPIVTHITGITDEHLVDAPQLEEILEEFLNFIGDAPIVGHNISFDLGFLKAKGVVFENTAYDTLQLTSILMQGLPSYSLDIITSKLGIEHKEKHRALDDAIATAKLFQILMGEIGDIDPEILDEIKVLVARSTWPLKDIFLAVKSDKTRKSVESERVGKKEAEISEENLEFNKEDILAFYEKEGFLSKVEKDYEIREPQIMMTEKIIDAYEGEHHLLCEAGTGTGKSIAYLLPSVFIARAKEEKVVIASHTKNLQDQLYKKDVPALEKAMQKFTGKDGEDNVFSAAVLKGRKNYLSVERLNKFKEKKFFQEHEITILIKILIWLPKTKTGDREELSLYGREYFSWGDVSCDSIKCPHSEHAFLSKCFLAKARERAEKADIIITNHALLLNDTVMPSPVLPEHHYLVIDEAHHLENEATNALTITLTAELIEQSIKNLKGFVKKSPELFNKIDSLHHKIDLFFGLLGIFFEKFIEYANSIQHLMLNDYMEASLEWSKVRDCAENIVLQGEQVIKELKESENDVVIFERDTLQETIKNIAFVILEGAESDYGKYIRWIFRKMDGSLGIKAAPVHVGEHLKGTLLADKKSIVMTSATLTVNNTFNYIRNQLSLGEHFEEVTLPSYFSYPDQVKVVIYEDLQAPATPGYFEQTSDIIYKTAKENRGKMLVLFTSKKAIEATYMKLMPLLKQEGITILAQNISGGRNKIIELFKQDPENSIIFGTNSFWEGIDIKGTALNCVIIQKLPFDPPDDPVHSTRANLYENPFNEYQIPRAVLRFKQGFGRLIRSARDSGKVIVLDSRIFKKSYGHIFLDSLPEGVRVERKAT